VLGEEVLDELDDEVELSLLEEVDEADDPFEPFDEAPFELALPFDFADEELSGAELPLRA
jgi:hypothetical protein